MIIPAVLAAALAFQVCSVASEDNSELPCPLCPQCPIGFHTAKPLTKGAKCSSIRCECIPDAPKPSKKACPLVSCPRGRFGKCKKIDGCDICECLPICPPSSLVCRKGCLRKMKLGCPYCHCPVKWPRCPLAMCRMRCQYGFEVNANGCSICKCRKCPHSSCKMLCKNGFQIDDNGCEMCRCKQEAPVQCPLGFCFLFCENGYEVDANGCRICECRKCPIKKCRVFCKNGFEVDENGCELCKCKQDAPPKCPLSMCRMGCRFGFQVDANGCSVCKCNKIPSEIKPPRIEYPGVSGI